MRHLMPRQRTVGAVASAPPERGGLPARARAGGSRMRRGAAPQQPEECLQRGPRPACHATPACSVGRVPRVRALGMPLPGVPMALTTTIFRATGMSIISFAAFLMRSGEPTQVPPNLAGAAAARQRCGKRARRGAAKAGKQLGM